MGRAPCSVIAFQLLAKTTLRWGEFGHAVTGCALSGDGGGDSYSLHLSL